MAFDRLLLVAYWHAIEMYTYNSFKILSKKLETISSLIKSNQTAELLNHVYSIK